MSSVVPASPTRRMRMETTMVEASFSKGIKELGWLSVYYETRKLIVRDG